MMPDHMRALRTSAFLALVAAIPAFIAGLAAGAREQWVLFSMMTVVMLALWGIAWRCSRAYNRLSARYADRVRP